jgi:hypothetical protein
LLAEADQDQGVKFNFAGQQLMTIGNPRPPTIFSKACPSLNHHNHRQHTYSIGIKNQLALLENLHGRTLALPGISRVNSIQSDRMAEVVCFIYWCETDFDMLTGMFIRQLFISHKPALFVPDFLSWPQG